MNTKVAFLLLAALALIALGWFALSANRAAAPTEEPATASAETAPLPSTDEEDGGPAFTIITLTDSGFSPRTVTVAAGETVRFINDSSRSMWVGADEHPTHTEYDGTSAREHCVDGAAIGGSFDQCAAVARGEYWDYTFTRAGTFNFHNHTGASSVGTVVVR